MKHTFYYQNILTHTNIIFFLSLISSYPVLYLKKEKKSLKLYFVYNITVLKNFLSLIKLKYLKYFQNIHIRGILPLPKFKYYPFLS